MGLYTDRGGVRDWVYSTFIGWRKLADRMVCRQIFQENTGSKREKQRKNAAG